MPLIPIKDVTDSKDWPPTNRTIDAQSGHDPVSFFMLSIDGFLMTSFVYILFQIACSDKQK